MNVLVNFPISGLNMSPHILGSQNKYTEINQNKADLQEEEMTFDLFAVCNHYGNMMGGHYTGRFWYCVVYCNLFVQDVRNGRYYECCYNCYNGEILYSSFNWTITVLSNHLLLILRLTSGQW